MSDQRNRRRFLRRTPKWAVAIAAAAILLSAAPLLAGEGEGSTGSGGGSKKEHPLVPALRYARASLKAVQEIDDYTATFIKRDIVDGRVYQHTTRMKFRAEPMSVYLKFQRPHQGREVIYVKGRNGGKLLAHDTGLASLAGTVALDPQSPKALSESKHPITEIGMENLVGSVIAQWEKESRFGEIDVTYYPNATHKKLGKTKCLVIQAVHPRPRKEFPFHMTRLWIDKKTKFPVRVTQWGFPRRGGGSPPLLEAYTYSGVKTDVGLTDIDFDVRNPNYDF